MKGQDAVNSDFTRVNRIKKLEEKILSRLSGRVHYFRIVLMAEGVILRGHAQTFHAKQLAQHAVMEETSLPILANEIEVS